MSEAHHLFDGFGGFRNLLLLFREFFACEMRLFYLIWGWGFGVGGYGFWVWGLGFGVWGFGVWGLEFGVGVLSFVFCVLGFGGLGSYFSVKVKG